MAVSLDLGQKHKRQAEVPRCTPPPPAQTCAQSKVNPHIREKHGDFLSALPLHPVTSKKPSKVNAWKKCSAAKRFEGNG